MDNLIISTLQYLKVTISSVEHARGQGAWPYVNFGACYMYSRRTYATFLCRRTCIKLEAYKRFFMPPPSAQCYNTLCAYHKCRPFFMA